MNVATTTVKSASFGRHVGRLTHYGYDCIPITRPTDRIPDAGKRPAISGWQNGCPREAWNQYADCGLGILTERTPAIDIDFLDEDLADKIHRVMDRALGGEPPYRIGQAPKLLIPCRLDGDPFNKLKVTWRSLGDGLHEPTRPPAVEILARGQQFIAIGLHNRTGQLYRWHRDPWLSLPRIFLPPLSYEKAVRIMRALAHALECAGATDIKVSGVREPAPKLARPGRKPGLWRSNVRRIADALEEYGNGDLHYDDWVRIGHALKRELPGADGLALWEWWSSLSAKNDPQLTKRKWDSFNPTEITAGTIFYLAEGGR